MGILTLYRSKKMFSYEDNYGGNVFENYYYTYLVLKDDIIFIFSSSPMYSSSKLKPITSFDDSNTLNKLDIMLKTASNSTYENIEKHTIKFILPIHIADKRGSVIVINRIYNAFISEIDKLLKLKAWNDNEPNKLVVEEEFERIDTPVGN